MIQGASDDAPWVGEMGVGERYNRFSVPIAGD